MTNLTMIEKVNESYWEDFYKKANFENESTFCKLIKEKIETDIIILDVGCGLGRDAFSFARDGYQVIGIDKSEEAINKNIIRKKSMNENLGIDFKVVDLSNELTLKDLVNELQNKAESEFKKILVYLRFLLHSIDEQTQNVLLKTLSNYLPTGSLLAAEFRTLEDKSRSKFFGGHYRRFIDADGLLIHLEEKLLFNKILFEKGTGLSKFNDEDPFLGRIIVEKNGN